MERAIILNKAKEIAEIIIRPSESKRNYSKEELLIEYYLDDVKEVREMSYMANIVIKPLDEEGYHTNTNTNTNVIKFARMIVIKLNKIKNSLSTDDLIEHFLDNNAIVRLYAEYKLNQIEKEN